MLRRVVGDSMTPALMPGRLVVGIRRVHSVRAGDIVIVNHAGLEKIKRVEAIRGRGAGREVFVLGDNPPHSTDSRTFGWLPYSSLAAKVLR